MQYNLNQIISIAKPIKTRDAVSGVVEYWQTIAKLWAQVDFVKEFAHDNGTITRHYHLYRVMVRTPDAPLFRGMKVEYNNKNYKFSKLIAKDKKHTKFTMIRRVMNDENF